MPVGIAWSKDGLYVSSQGKVSLLRDTDGDGRADMEEVIACHSGKPDWGTGPKGQGKIFKISYTDPATPQPVAIWATSPMELSIAFDRPIARAVARELARTRIEFGEHVSAADRLETLKPPYKVVKAQTAAPRGKLGVTAARLSADARTLTLTLTTDPHAQAVRYALELAGTKAAGASSAATTIDLDYDLHGVGATWSADGESWTGWLPHLNSEVNAALLAQSAEHERVFDLLRRKGRLHVRVAAALGDAAYVRPGVGKRAKRYRRRRLRTRAVIIFWETTGLRDLSPDPRRRRLAWARLEQSRASRRSVGAPRHS